MVGIFQTSFDDDDPAGSSGGGSSAQIMTYSQDAVDQLLAEAREKDIDEGYSAGYKKAVFDVNESLKADSYLTLVTLKGRIDELLQQSDAYLGQIEDETLALAKGIADKILPGFKKQFSRLAAGYNMREVLRLARGIRCLTVYLSPDTHAYLDSQGLDLKIAVPAGHEMTVVDDPSLSDGAGRVEWKNGQAEYSLDRICIEIFAAMEHTLPEIITDEEHSHGQ